MLEVQQIKNLRYGRLKICATRTGEPEERVRRPQRGYLLTEALVYIGVVFVILGIGYLAMYRCIDHCVLMRRNADDIARAVHAGERWRVDVRAAAQRAGLDGPPGDQVLRLEGPRGRVDYRWAAGAVYRRSAPGDWVCVLDRVKACAFELDARPQASAWRWELELQPRAKGALKPGRVRPLFTFLAVRQPLATP